MTIAMEHSINILDTLYCHQGHQYEFFKVPCNFTLCQSNAPNRTPVWGKQGRPLRDNVRIMSLSRSMNPAIMPKGGYDVIIHRVSSRPYYYKPLLKNNPKVICVMQTTTPYKIPRFATDIVWNSQVSMKKFSKDFDSKIKHHYIPHGFDPKEFRPMPEISKEKDVMIIACDFIERNNWLNYKLWHDMSQDLSTLKFEVWGHQRVIQQKKHRHRLGPMMAAAGIEGHKIDKTIRSSTSLENLVETYNSYKVYFNTTSNSAMPRGRAEAMMCGTPIVTTNNFDISNYLSNGSDCVLSNDPKVLKKGIIDIINDESAREYYSKAARRAAVKHFHIDDYIKRWMRVIEG